MWAFLLALCLNHTTDLQKRPHLDFGKLYEYKNQTKIFTGYVEYENNIPVLHHMPAGKFPNAVLYRHNLIVTNPQQKILLDKAEKQDKAVKIVGQITNILGKQTIVIETVIILDFSSN
jgi:hypothetical protein